MTNEQLQAMGVDELSVLARNVLTAMGLALPIQKCLRCQRHPLEDNSRVLCNYCRDTLIFDRIDERAKGLANICPNCNGLDVFCTLCDGNGKVSQSQADEWLRQNETAG